MKVVFRTNLDLAFPETWPDLDHIPQIGSYVESKSGLELKVVGVTYKLTGSAWGEKTTQAHVELHLGTAWESRSIADFNKWDRERVRK